MPSLYSVARIVLISFCWLLVLRTHAQTRTIVAQESTLDKQVYTLDSVNSQATNSLSILKYDYDSIKNKYNSLIARLQTKADSLQAIGLPFHTPIQKMDSINNVKEAKLWEIKKKVETLKFSTIEKINELNLPTDLRSKVYEYTESFNKIDLSIPVENLELPSLDIIHSVNLRTPDLNSPIPGDIPDLSPPNMAGVDEISNAASRLRDLNQSIPKEVPKVDQLDELAEAQIGQIKQVSAVQDQIGNLPTAFPTSEEQAKKQMLDQAKDVVVDHFAGKEQELKSAMDQISKYKKKFHSVNNLEELAQLIKKRPNEMKGKPLIERLVPGIAFQLQKKNDLLFVDLNPYIGYRLTGKLSGGVGWNQRVSYNLNTNTFHHDSRIYGPRVYSEFKLWRGFSPRIEVETMNTFVPPYIKVSPADLGQREWVWGVFVGMKKDYKFWKKINGSAQVMFRLFDPHRKSPYADVVNARFGFEFPMKKVKRQE